MNISLNGRALAWCGELIGVEYFIRVGSCGLCLSRPLQQRLESPKGFELRDTSSCLRLLPLAVTLLLALLICIMYQHHIGLLN